MGPGTRSILLLGALLPLCAAAAAPTAERSVGTAPPDLAPPGMKVVHTELVFELADAVADRRFAVSPGGGRMRVVVPGARIGMGSYPRVHVYALADGEELPDPVDWYPHRTEEWPTRRARADLPVRRAPPVPASSPIARVVHHVRLLAVDGDAIRFEVLQSERLDSSGQPVDETLVRVVWIALATIGATGLVLLARRRRRAAAEAPA